MYIFYLAFLLIIIEAMLVFIQLREYGEGNKERLLRTSRAGQDYFESILNQLNFQGDINSSKK